MSWICGNCGSRCKTPESYGLHVKRCRAMSEREILNIIDTYDSENEVGTQGGLAKAIHVFHIQKLRGKRR